MCAHLQPRLHGIRYHWGCFQPLQYGCCLRMHYAKILRTIALFSPETVSMLGEEAILEVVPMLAMQMSSYGKILMMSMGIQIQVPHFWEMLVHLLLLCS